MKKYFAGKQGWKKKNCRAEINHRILIRASFTDGVRVGVNTKIIKCPLCARLLAKPFTHNPGGLD